MELSRGGETQKNTPKRQSGDKGCVQTLTHESFKQPSQDYNHITNGSQTHTHTLEPHVQRGAWSCMGGWREKSMHVTNGREAAAPPASLSGCRRKAKVSAEVGGAKPVAGPVPRFPV